MKVAHPVCGCPKGRRHEVLINRDPVALIRLTVVVEDVHGADTVAYQPQLIVDQVVREYPGTSLETVFIGEEEGKYFYVAVFEDAEKGHFYRAWFNAGTGIMMRSTMTVAPPGEGLSLGQAVAAALAQVPGGQLYDVHYQQIGAGFLYLVNVIVGGQDITVTVNATTGTVLGTVAAATTLTPATQGQPVVAARTAQPEATTSNQDLPQSDNPKPETPESTLAPVKPVTLRPRGSGRYPVPTVRPPPRRTMTTMMTMMTMMTMTMMMMMTMMMTMMTD